MVSLGCPKNTVDGEVLLGDLSRSGYQITEQHEEADVVVINTCGFVEDAKAESLEAVMDAVRLKAARPGTKVVMTGCLTQRYSQELAAELPEVDLMVGFQNYGNLPASLAGLLGTAPASGVSTPSTAGQPARVQVGEATVQFRPEGERHRLTPPHTAYLRVAEGCNHSCTFCAIPGFRGKFRSKPWAAVLAEAARLVEEGAVELNLIAEDTNQYGQDRRDGRDLAVLLRELSALPRLRWLRILYAYPSYFSEELIDEIANNPKVCKYIDMPLQHISNMTLLAMMRPPQSHTVSLLTKLRQRIPGLALRTTFISGFPGETEEQHRELVQFCQGFRFERMGAFVYSQEDGTPAASMPDQVEAEVREARRDELVSIQQGISTSFARSLVGCQVEVLVDGYDGEGNLVGRTQYDAPDVDPLVFLGAPRKPGVAPAQPGQMRLCTVSGVSICDLEAYPVA